MGGAALFWQAIMGNPTPAIPPTPPPPPKVSNAEGILFGEKYRKVANSLVMEGKDALVHV